MRSARVLTAALLLALAAGPVAVRAAQCSVATTGLAFGAYDVLAAGDLTAAGSITVTCDRNGTVQLSLSAGSSGSGSNRIMRSASGNSLAYNVFSDAGRTSPWTDRTVNPKKNVPYTVPVYGAIFAHQDAAAGAYGDGLTVSVTF